MTDISWARVPIAQVPAKRILACWHGRMGVPFSSSFFPALFFSLYRFVTVAPVVTVSWRWQANLPPSVIEKTTSSTLNWKVYFGLAVIKRERKRERDVVRENKIGEMWGRLIWKAAATIKSSSWLSPLIYRARRLWTLPPLHALHTPHNHIQSHPCIHPITSLDRKIPPKIFKSNLSIIFFYWIQ